jgi:MFS superfamily sulfate permease-like transporter
VPGGLPSLSIPTAEMTTDNVLGLLPTVISLVVVILAQSAATSRAYAMKYNDGFDENVDLVGLSTASIAAGFTGTFVVNGSPTKTEMVDSAGGRSQISQITCGAIVIVVLLFLTGPLAYMPNAVLAAVVFLIGIRLVDVRGMADVARLRRGEFAVAAATAATVVIVGVEQGIILAMALSIVEHVYHSYKPSDHVLGLGPDGYPTTTPLGSGAQVAPGLAVYRFGANLYYANTARFTEEVAQLAEDADPPLRWLAISGSVIADIDYQGSEAIRSVKGELDRRGVTLALCDIEPGVRDQLDAYRLTSLIGEDRIYPTVAQVLAAYRSAT